MTKIQKQIAGLFSIVTAWLVTMIIASIYLVIRTGNSSNLESLMSWSAIFVIVAWVVFIILPLLLLDHSRKIFRPTIFPFVTGLYAMAVYILLFNILFGMIEVLENYLPWALIIGLVFGLLYSLLITSEIPGSSIRRKPVLTLSYFLSPLFLSLLWWWILPLLLGGIFFRFTPKTLQDQIAIRTLPNFRKGDSYSALEHHLPGYFLDTVQNGNGGLSQVGGLFNYNLDVKNDTIQVIEFHLNK